MIVCPNCNHQNPDGATQCEACYTPLPATTSCPNCGATVQTDASFCGQCGTPLGGGMPSAPNPLPDIPELVPPDPLIPAEPTSAGFQQPEVEPTYTSSPDPSPVSPPPATIVSPSMRKPTGSESSPDLGTLPPQPAPFAKPSASATASSSTRLQVQTASLLHVQTNMKIELPEGLSVIHLGKPNDQIPPDIDVSGFPNSEIVSRIHADIRVEGDTYYLEDVGSSNGTYVNHTPLPKGNRHKLRTGDRISLGKGDQVTFLFQIS